MQFPAPFFSLRHSLLSRLTEPLNAHPSLTESIRKLVEQILGTAQRGAEGLNFNIQAWASCRATRPDLAVRLARLGTQAKEMGLTIGPIWQRVAEAAGLLQEPFEGKLFEEPLPIEVDPAILQAAQRSNDVLIDALMGLNRLREDPAAQDRFIFQGGDLHPNMQALLVETGVSESLLVSLVEAQQEPLRVFEPASLRYLLQLCCRKGHWELLAALRQ